MTRSLGILLLICFLPSFWGCSLISRTPPAHSPEIADILDRIDRQDQSIHSVNGLASATITDKNGKTRYRLAWAVEKPDHLRLIVLFSGKPVETVLYDGSQLIIMSHTNAHETIKRHTRNPNLEKLVSLPIRADRLINLLSAGLPVCPHRSGKLEKNDQNGYTLTLFNWRGKPVQVFHLDENRQLLACEFQGKKNIQYRMDYSPSQSNETFFPPHEMTLSQEDRSLHIRIDQIHPNPALSPDTFKLPAD